MMLVGQPCLLADASALTLRLRQVSGRRRAAFSAQPWCSPAAAAPGFGLQARSAALNFAPTLGWGGVRAFCEA